jgi:hypothetical protein
VRSPLGREAKKEPACFASISGKLDAVKHLKGQAKETKEMEREQAKEVRGAPAPHSLLLTVPQVQNKTHTTGKELRASMMHGHRPKRTHSSDTDSSDKENADSGSMASMTRTKCTRRTPSSCNSSNEQIGHLISLLERNKKFQHEALEEQCEANRRALALQESSTNTLLGILREGLLGGGGKALQHFFWSCLSYVCTSKGLISLHATLKVEKTRETPSNSVN